MEQIHKAAVELDAARYEANVASERTELPEPSAADAVAKEPIEGVTATVIDIHPLDLGDKLNAMPDNTVVVVNANDTLTIEGQVYRQTIDADPQGEAAKELAAEVAVAALDAALAAQGDEEMSETLAVIEDAKQLEISILDNKIKLLAMRLDAVEQRIEDHNARSGHKI